MNPFTDLQTRPSPWARVFARPALLVFALYFVVGMALVAWRVSLYSQSAHALARAEAQARAAALEAQLNQVPAAAEVLGALARQSRGGLPEFQKVAAEVLARHPGLSSLELQPGGIVMDIVPREGNERALGVNVLRDAGQSAGANEAIARRALTVSGPVRLYRGEPGLVARVPVFQRAADGRESFWGFVAATMRLQEALTWTEVDRLPRRGYGFAFFVPATNHQKALSVVYNSPTSLADSEQQPLHVQNLEFRLAVKPRAGWVPKTEAAVESVAVLLLAAFASFLASGRESRRSLEAELAQVAKQLTQEQAKRSAAEAAHTQVQQQMAAAQGQLEGAQVDYQQAAARVAELEAQLQASAREREQAAQEQAAHEKEAQSDLLKAQETIAQLHARVEAASQSEKASLAAAEERGQQQAAAMEELRSKLEAAKRAAREEAKTKAAALAQVEQENRELKAQLEQAQHAAARVTELEALLHQAREELKPQPADFSAEEEVPFAEEASAPEAAVEAPEPSFDAPAADPETEPDWLPAEEIPAESRHEEPAPEPEPVAPVNADEAPATEAAIPASEETETESATPPAAPEPPAEPIAETEPPAAPKPAAKPPRRKKSSRDDQMDLFGGDSGAAQTNSKQSTKAAERASEGKEAHAAEKPVPRLPPAPPVDEAELRKAVHLIVPLLADQDPGAKDCLRDNRNTFRSAFTPEAYVDFEQLVKRGDFTPALEDLKKAARKHGIPV